MWADAETDIDFLNYSEVAELIAELIADQNLLPLSLGVFGGWGMGKSSTLRLVETELNKDPDRYLIVKFDAWLYQDFDDARAALMGVISSALVKSVPENLKDKALKLVGRVNKLRALGLLVEGGALAMGVPAFGAITKGFEALGTAFGSKPENTDMDSVKGAAADAQSRMAGLLNPVEQRSPPEEIDAFRAEFGQILSSFKRTLVVFIDNLDRCLPNNAIQTLEAVRLFLFMPKTAFVVAADEDMIRHAVTQHFSNPSERHVADYLDKLIQMPVRIPRVGVQEVRAYLFLLLTAHSGLSNEDQERARSYLIERLRMSWNKDGNFTVKDVLKAIGGSGNDELAQSLEMADRMAPVLAHSPGVLGNPRTVKRMLNVVRMRASVARKRSMPLDEAVITKLALFERCTDAASSEALHNAINAASDGKPEILLLLEKQGDRDFESQLPKPWLPFLPFVKEWSQLEPSLGGMDLRPAVYLSRETVPLRISSATISPNALRAAETLIKVTTISSPAGKSALDTLSTEEFPLAMEAIIAEMRKNSDWNRARSDFRGALITASRSDEAATLLVRFIRSLQLPAYPGWMRTMLKGAAWWSE